MEITRDVFPLISHRFPWFLVPHGKKNVESARQKRRIVRKTLSSLSSGRIVKELRKVHSRDISDINVVCTPYCSAYLHIVHYDRARVSTIQLRVRSMREHRRKKRKRRIYPRRKKSKKKKEKSTIHEEKYVMSVKKSKNRIKEEM